MLLMYNIYSIFNLFLLSWRIKLVSAVMMVPNKMLYILAYIFGNILYKYYCVCVYILYIMYVCIYLYFFFYL